MNGRKINATPDRNTSGAGAAATFPQRTRLLGLLVGGLLLSLFLPLDVAGESPSLDGYTKHFLTVLRPGSLESDPSPSPLGAVNQRLRLNLHYAPSETLSLEMAYDAILQVQDPALFGEARGSFLVPAPPYRVDDLRVWLYPRDPKRIASFAVSQNLDRASLTWSPAWGDLILGRQAIAWGSARAVNPTDVFAPLRFDALDTEERPGVDALRLRIPVGALGEVDLGAVFGERFRRRQSGAFLRAKLYVANTDATLLMAGFRQNILVGVDLTRALGGFGSWLEAAYVVPDGSETDPSESGDDFLRATVGVDHSLGGSGYAFLEYHFNGAGVGEPERYLQNLEHPAYTDGMAYLMGRHYLIPGVSGQLTPLLAWSCQAIWNLSDASLLIAGQLEYNVAQDVYLMLGAFLGLGRSPQATSDGRWIPRSEFGFYTDLLFSSFRVYF